MDWTQFAIFFIGVFGLWLWQRSESRTDSRKNEKDVKELRREMIDILRSIEEECKDFRAKWAEESKEFHGRLISIEERRGK